VTEKRRIVVIDDDDAIREVLSLTLTGEGYDVETAGSGAEGLVLLGQRPADLVIADLKMPDIDGVEFCRAYARGRNGVRPVILMSAMPADALDRGVPGVIGFVTKPFDIEPFIGMIAGAIANGGVTGA
jgi:CheY-like chemotaxis protein